MSQRTTIVVGSGSAGGALAARLSEDPDEHVILIEAGPDYPTAEDLPEELSTIHRPVWEGPHDWDLSTYPLEPPSSRPAVGYARGRVVGGSSTVNGGAAQRGFPGDFNAWAAAGNPEWAWEHVLPCFRKGETDLAFAENTAIHGDSGPIPVWRTPKEQWPPAVHAFEQASFELGHPECPDHNDPVATGIGPVPRNQRGTLRAGTLLTYIAEARHRPNFEIRAQTTVHRVVFNGRRAVGVDAEHDGQIATISADRVVLCGGFIKSPQLLMLSGIGPKAHLNSVGIEPIVDLPGVGQNVLDHCVGSIVAAPTDQEQPTGALQCALKYASDGGATPDILIIPSVLPAMLFAPESDLAMIALYTIVLGKPRSAGWLALRSNDVHEAPELHSNYLAEEIDRRTLGDALRTVHELLSTSPITDELREFLTPTAAQLRDPQALEQWLLENVTPGLHGAGSCRMGPETDPMAVVSQYLDVHGTEGLYVADASIMPEITAATTNMSCYMIGERAAELLAPR